jgi:enoyl-CoA hydratase/carnithine racemase
MMMIHDAWGIGFGTADQIRKTADVLDSVTATIAATYVKRAKADAGKIRAMMSAETWLTAKEAKDAGLADKVVDSMDIQACAFDPRRFRNAPAAVLDRNAARPARDRYAARFQRLQVEMIKTRTRSASAA